MIKHQQNEVVGSSSSTSSQNSAHSHSVVVSFVDSRGSITKFVSREDDFENVDDDVILENCDETVFRPVVTVFSEFDDGSDKVEIKMNENFVQTIHPELVVPVIDEKMMECTRKQEATAKQMVDKIATETVEEKKVADAQPQIIIEKVVEKVEKVQAFANLKKNKKAKKSARFSSNNSSQQQFELAKPLAEQIISKTELQSEIAERVEEIHDEIVIIADVGSQELAEMEMRDEEKNEKSDEIEIITEENLAALDVPTSPITFDAEMIEIHDVESPEEMIEIQPKEVVVDEAVVEPNEVVVREEIVALPPPPEPEAVVEVVESTSKRARRSKKNNKRNTANSSCNNNVETNSDFVVTELAPPPVTTPAQSTIDETDNKPTNDELEIVADCFSKPDDDEIAVSKEGLEKMKLTHFYDNEEELEIDLAPLSSFDAHFADEPQIDDMLTEKNESLHLKSKISEVVKNTNMIFAMCSSLKDAVENDEDTKSTSSQSQIQRSTSSSVTTNTTTSTFASANSMQTGEGVESDYKSFEIDADIDEIKTAESEDISSVDATSSETDDASMKRSFENEPKYKAGDDEELRPLLQTSQNSLSSPSENEMKNPATSTAPTAAEDESTVVVSEFPSLADANPKLTDTPITVTSTVTTSGNNSRNKKNKRKRR